MKIEVRIEGDTPILFFTDEIEQDKTISCWDGSHCASSRAYMRSLKKPETPDQQLKAWGMLERYAAHVVYTMKL